MQAAAVAAMSAARQTYRCRDDNGRPPPVRVYADGVFDLFHSGHLAFLRQARRAAAAAGGGTPPPRVVLVAGVMPDEAAGWKRRPIIPHAQRVAMLRHCTLVDEVVEDPPLVLTDEFLDAHRIDLVVHGDDDRQERFFAAPIARGIMRYVPYTQEGPLAASTTKIIRRIQGLNTRT